MIQYRHNGQALVYGNEADISRDSTCDRDSTLEGQSYVHSSALSCTSLENTKVFNSRIDNSAAVNSTFCMVEVYDSIVLASFITDAHIRNCRLRDVLIRFDQQGEFESKRQVLQRVRLNGVVIDGDVILDGPWSLSGPYYICEGTWTRAPRTTLIQGENGVCVGITESIPGKVNVGQRNHEIDQWLRCGRRLGRIAGWDEAQINQAESFMESLVAMEVAA